MDEEERDVTLHNSNWIKPSENGPGIASGYAEPTELYEHVETMSNVTWPEFMSWLSAPAARVNEQGRLPLIPEEVVAGGRPFVVGHEGSSWHYSRDIPTMAALTIDNTGEAEEQRHVAVFELPESSSKSELKQRLLDVTAANAREVNGMTVLEGGGGGVSDNGQLIHSVIVLEDGLLLTEVGSGGELTGDESDFHLQETLERAGTERDLADHPVRRVTDMDIVTTYGPAFIEDAETAPRSQSVGIDLEAQVKRVILTYPNPDRAARTGERFSTDDGNIQFTTEEGTALLAPRAVAYQEIRQEGRALVFEADIPDLTGTIRDGPPTWSYGIADR
ncbi:hypothetical protein [Halosimplex pelagicum]|uniref:Uncharacterized protein n=1 Tax=Halosimplex pelagicum TaxID=869886 RepID=A0A7D5TBH9_9EURY|nr:hypothetical protein [Halosimplex pelagicum]QLH81315.1 hypothetical protein HZS54_06585 [Halosimplex pelagicum]